MADRPIGLPVRLQIAGSVAVVQVVNPPVNVLSAHVRAAIAEALDRVSGDPLLHAMVLTGIDGFFLSGADIREMGTPHSKQEPLVSTLQGRLTQMPKVTIAALNGVTLGGGLELALACNARIAAPTARLGFPENNIGIVPGTGGTHRLPRS